MIPTDSMQQQKRRDKKYPKDFKIQELRRYPVLLNIFVTYLYIFYLFQFFLFYKTEFPFEASTGVKFSRITKIGYHFFYATVVTWLRDDITCT